MGWLLRISAYIISGLAIWQFISEGPGAANVLPIKRLALDPANGMIFGVCAGFSNYFGIDVTLIRLVWALAAFYRGIGIGLYILAFLIMPTG